MSLQIDFVRIGHKQKKSIIKSVEDVPVVEMQRMSYERYVSDKNEKAACKRRHKTLPRKLLEKNYRRVNAR